MQVCKLELPYQSILTNLHTQQYIYYSAHVKTR